MEERWRYPTLLPAFAVVCAFVVGQMVSAWLFSGTPVLRSISFVDKAPFTEFLGFELAARQRMVTMTFLLVIATVLLVLAAASVVRHVWKEHKSSVPTKINKQDWKVGIFAFAGLVILIVLVSVFTKVHCNGGNYVYYCLGKDVHPGILQQFLALAEPRIDAKYAETYLEWIVDLASGAAIIAGGALLLALLMLLRGLENFVQDATFIDQVAAWHQDRLNRLQTLSLLAVLVLVIAIAQMSTWLAWPLPLMSEELVSGGGKLNAGYSDIVKSLLQFHGIWFSIIVAALIIPTKMVITDKCRAYVDAAAGIAGTDPAKVTKLRDQLSTGTDLKSVLDRYRSYLLILAPPLAQQVLQSIPQAN